MPRRSRYRELAEVALGLVAGDLDASERVLVELVAQGHMPAAAARRLGRSRKWAYECLGRLELKVGPVSGDRLSAAWLSTDPVAAALRSDSGRVRMAADLGLRRHFSELPYCHKQVAGVNALGWQPRCWMARDRERRRAYLTEVGHAGKDGPRGLLVGAECRLLCRDLLELARVRMRVRCEGSEPPPPFPEGRGGSAEWLAVGSDRGPWSVRQLLSEVRGRLLSVVPSPERVRGLRLRPPGGARRLEVYLVPRVWVAARWSEPWPGADRELWQMRLVRAVPVGRFSFEDGSLGEEQRVVGFLAAEGGGRRVVLSPLWEDARLESDLPALGLYWRHRAGSPWFVLDAGCLQVDDRVRAVGAGDSWVLLARDVKVRELPAVAVARLTAEMVGKECLVATAGEVARLAGAGDPGPEDRAWWYRYAPNGGGRGGGKRRREDYRLERVWL